ncbi:undecaprenyl/decaprenyl-phosphate alpha-N-acetylglucosaminyl 1-phosphate transferase [Patescibacteria group bacterium]|nr:MAG: undecaprenyl/decaprenyl-phosphate alpha-N-acetylglucosaminyl 1-phosphate transferase [Patescibacteria group bacterium]
MPAFLAASLAFLGTLFLTPAIARVSELWGIVDCTEKIGPERRKKPVPLLGGVAVFFVFAVIVLAWKFWRLFPAGLVPWQSVLGLLAGGLILLLGGLLDDRYNLSPRIQIIFPLLAATAAVASGITISYIRSPFGGVIPLDRWVLPLASFSLTLPADALAFLWLLGMTYTTKVLDGLDGLVAGLAVISFGLIYAVALRPELSQPDVSVLAAAAGGAFGGFLAWNFHPARIFLGESGSTFAGYLIGALAIISGSKVAAALLVLGAPIVDLAGVILERRRAGRRITGGDLRHFHFRLMTAGLSERQTVLTLYLVAIAFGSIGLLATTAGKAAAFLILAAVVTLANRWLRGKLKKGSTSTALGN